ncbi:MFS transporter [Staphylococcus muscae]|uniref:Chloramphenicol resistance protein n=1 Tax=Staphylococcus muscae TaxID=1294 RepID=A0A240C6M5_9STAP|nr:MFS transporter [Staphylococcus muscae]AVQ33581.1 MFS transporter [Staphylococcus muscae]PNZ04862.1 MFS transporter [Staphylococcus muscae]GGA86016.1 chloramphenicol resistance protein [Staphylococcus muscae]SNW03570.1 major facilitator family transporter [Staphylococcus muscae]
MTVMRTFTFMLSIFIVGMVEMVVAGIMSLMSADLHISEAWIGQLVTVYAFTFALTGPILVKLTERYAPKPVLLVTIAVFIIGNMMIALSPNFIVLVIGRILSSAAAALIVVKILAITSFLSEPHKRGRMLGIVYTGFSASNVFGVPIGTLIGDWLGWRFTFGLISFVGLLVTILLTIYLPRELHMNIHTHNSTSNNQPNVHSKKEIIKLLAVTFILLTANSIAYIYINPLILSGGHTLQYVSLALLVIGVAGMLGTSMGGYFTDKLSFKTWLIFSSLAFAVILTLLNQLWATSILLLITLFAWHIIEWSTNPAVQSGLISQVHGDHSQVMSWNMSALNAGIGLGALLGGVIVSHLSLHATVYIAAATSLLAFFIVITLQKPQTSH